MLACVYGAYLIVGNNCHRVVLIPKYMYGHTYMEVFRLQLRAQIYILHIQLWGWAEIKFLCRYTNNETCSPTSYVIYERTYVCHHVCRRSFNFPKFVRTYRTCMHHDKLSLFHTCIVPPLINLILGYVTLIHYDFVSRELLHVVGTDGSTD